MAKVSPQKKITVSPPTLQLYPPHNSGNFRQGSEGPMNSNNLIGQKL